MTCDNCSKCCEFLVFQIGERTNEDIERWASFHNVEIVDIQGFKYIKINNRCNKLIDGRCSIYEDRPELCKKYHCENPDYSRLSVLL